MNRLAASLDVGADLPRDGPGQPSRVACDQIRVPYPCSTTRSGPQIDGVPDDRIAHDGLRSRNHHPELIPIDIQHGLPAAASGIQT